MTRKTRAKDFSLALYRTPVGEKFRLAGIEFQIHTGRLDEHIDPVLNTLPTGTIDYGNLFTYCFRRFGYPNIGSDSYKDIAQWWLTTPSPNLILGVRPSVLPEPYFSIFFLTTQDIATAARHWERQDVDAWVDRKLDWTEAQGLPEWMPAFLKSYQEQEWPGATWRDAYRGYIAMFTPRETASPFATAKETAAQAEHRRILTEFAAKVEEYVQIEPRPRFRRRSTSISEWPEDDPMKPMAIAAVGALRDLATPVRVRDSAINAYGVVVGEAELKAVSEPESAGLGVADMINEAPKQSVELYQLARRLGGSDMKAGIERILELGKGVGQ